MGGMVEFIGWVFDSELRTFTYSDLEAARAHGVRIVAAKERLEEVYSEVEDE